VKSAGKEGAAPSRWLSGISLESSMIFQILTTTFTFACSGLAFWISARLHSDNRKSRKWPSVSGTVVERGIEPMQSDARTFTPRVRYHYTVAGREYAGHQVYRTGRAGSMKQSAQRLVDGLPDSIPVHYNPEDPSQAFLLANPSWIFWVAIASGAVAFVWGLQQALALIT
jgi:hypothetical protein